jgi:hypothetical protein
MCGEIQFKVRQNPHMSIFMKILINYPHNDSPTLNILKTRLFEKLDEIEGISYVKNRDISNPAEYDLIINIGFSHRIIAETFKFLHRIQPSCSTQLLLFNAAGESWLTQLKILAQKAVDEMNCDYGGLTKIHDFWSIKELLTFIKYNLKVLTTNEQPPI